MDTPDLEIDLAARRELQRATSGIIGQLEQRTIVVRESDQPAELGDLLAAVERFEQAVAARGGDSMTNTPESTRPENVAYVIPARSDDESARAYIRRIDEAAARIFARAD